MRKILHSLLLAIIVIPCTGARLFDDSAGDNLATASAILSGAPITMSTWIKTDDATDNFQIVMSTSQAGTDNYFRGRVRMTSVKIECRTRSTTASGDADTTAVPTAGTWAHLCCVFAGVADRRALLDGGNKGTNTTSVTPLSLDVTEIGRSDDGSPADNWSGDLAQAAMWSAGLTDQECATLAAGVSPLRVRRDALVGYWPINGGQSPEPNVVGTGFNMTVTGTTKSEEPPIPATIVAP